MQDIRTRKMALHAGCGRAHNVLFITRVLLSERACSPVRRQWSEAEPYIVPIVYSSPARRLQYDVMILERALFFQQYLRTGQIFFYRTFSSCYVPIYFRSILKACITHSHVTSLENVTRDWSSDVLFAYCCSDF